MIVLISSSLVVPEVFRVAAAVQKNRFLEDRIISDPVSETRRRCPDAFHRTSILNRLIPLIAEILAAGELAMPEADEEAMPIAFEDPVGRGDAGHRG